ncbi:MAG: chromate transporter [Peptostreptococcus anaerobius]
MGNIYLLVYYFFTTGLFSIGGGLATLPFLYDIGQKTGWYTAMDVANMVAIAQSTPGLQESTWLLMLDSSSLEYLGHLLGLYL